MQLTELEPDGIIMNPKDFWRVMLTKTTGSSSSGQYIFADPHQATQPSLWGKPVVITQAMAEGQFMVGAFRMAAAIWDRADATVEISREHSDFFVKNLCALLCEERLTLTVYRPEAILYAGFPYGS